MKIKMKIANKILTKNSNKKFHKNRQNQNLKM